MQEVWKDIKGFEGKYQISNTGKVKSLNYNNTNKEILLKPVKDKYGYLKVNLYGKKICTYRIHRLVAENFMEKPRLEVNHLNGDKTNNSIENLEWCTHPENERYSWKCLGKKARCGQKRTITHNKKAIIQYDLKQNYIRRWESAAEAGRTLGINGSKIAMCCRKERNKAGGYKWRFAN